MDLFCIIEYYFIIEFLYIVFWQIDFSIQADGFRVEHMNIKNKTYKITFFIYNIQNDKDIVVASNSSLGDWILYFIL